jgi:hypothetical protein
MAVQYDAFALSAVGLQAHVPPQALRAKVSGWAMAFQNGV